MDGIKEGLPPIKLPKYMFRTGGCYSFFEAKLKPFLQYDDLKPEVFQIFREIGEHWLLRLLLLCNILGFTVAFLDAVS